MTPQKTQQFNDEQFIKLIRKQFKTLYYHCSSDLSTQRNYTHTHTTKHYDLYFLLHIS